MLNYMSFHKKNEKPTWVSRACWYRIVANPIPITPQN